ncbi:uncharacterized protein [Misgurnus anguillicaudatus]|uniref:uncharacterized protein n=1 Tax=Misgurnus anguillicaudatus TaxID=75329 RepID=UPI003CCF4572
MQDTTVCDSKQSLQEDQTSTESLDSVCNAGEQQQILQTKLKMCSVKLIDCTNLMMKIKTEPTEMKTEPTEMKTEPTEIETEPTEMKTEPTEIKTDPTEEEDRTEEDDDFIPSDVKSDSCLDIEIMSSTSKERLTAQTLSCITCGKTFSSQRHLERHERKHTEQKLFTRSEISFTTLQEKKLHSEEHREKKKKKQFHCEQCGKIFGSSSNLNVHMRTHSDEKPFNCTECGNSFKTKQHLKIHQRVHTGEKPYECPHCEKRFSCKYNLKRHVLSHTNERPYQCSECDKTFRDSGSLKKHQNTHIKEKLYQCSHCEKRFRHEYQLIVHQRIHTGEKPYVCSHCGKSFTSSSKFRVHQRVHTGEKPYLCSVCGKSFSQGSSLLKHKRIHTGEKPFKCSQCDMTFSYSGHFKVHQRVHTGEKPYACYHCRKSFTSSSKLIVHQRVHTGEKPYHCSVCGKSFSEQTTLLCHKRIHTGEKPYKCSQCDKTFAQSSSLKYHQRVHTGEKPYHCSVCGKSFSHGSSLLKHKRIHKRTPPCQLPLPSWLDSRGELAEEWQQAGVSASARTVRRRLLEDGLVSRSHFSPKKPIRDSLIICRKYSEWTAEDWGKVIFSDEAPFHLFGASGKRLVRRRKGERYHQSCVMPTVKHPKTIHVWGCFSSKRVGPLTILPKNTAMNKKWYQNTLQQQLLPTIQQQFGEEQCIFQHDGAPCHKAKVITKWLWDQNVEILGPWSGNSPDLNPIENLWSILKRRVDKQKPTNSDKLQEVIMKEWVAICQDLAQKLIKSTPSRIAEVLKQNGQHCKY